MIFNSAEIKMASTTNDLTTMRKYLYGKKRVQKALAKNPHAPWDILRILLPTCADDVLKNPVLPLLLVAEPGLFQKLAFNELKGLAENSDKLGELLAWDDESSWSEFRLTILCIKKGARGNRYWPTFPELSQYRAFSAQNGFLDQATQLFLLDHETNEDVLRAFAAQSKVLFVLETLLDNPVCHRDLAKNIALPQYYLDELAGNQSSEVRVAVAENPSTQHSTLKKLSMDRSVSVRRAIAKKQNLSPKFRKRFRLDTDEIVRSATTENAGVGTS